MVYIIKATENSQQRTFTQCGTLQFRPHFYTFFASCDRRDLFNAAFLSCWSELSEDQQDELIRSIELALTSQDIAEVTQTLLNLAEFMEHSDKVSKSLGVLG